MIDGLVLEAAKGLYAQLETARANKAQCRLLKERVEGALGLLERGEEVKQDDSYAMTLEALKDWLVEAKAFVAPFSEQRWYASFNRLRKAKETQARFGELNARLSHLMSELNVGAAFQGLVNQEQDKVAWQQDIGELASLVGSLAEKLDASHAEQTRLRTLLLDWKATLETSQGKVAHAAIVAPGSEADDADLSQTTALGVDIDVPAELVEDDAHAQRLQSLVDSLLPQVVTAYVVAPGAKANNANFQGASASGFRLNVRSRASVPAVPATGEDAAKESAPSSRSLAPS